VQLKGDANVNDLSRKPAGATTRQDTIDIVRLSKLSDSGDRDDDWITNVRQVTFAVATAVGNTSE
jgi:hypothetical protein